MQIKLSDLLIRFRRLSIYFIAKYKSSYFMCYSKTTKVISETFQVHLLHYIFYLIPHFFLLQYIILSIYSLTFIKIPRTIAWVMHFKLVTLSEKSSFFPLSVCNLLTCLASTLLQMISAGSSSRLPSNDSIKAIDICMSIYICMIPLTDRAAVAVQQSVKVKAQRARSMRGMRNIFGVKWINQHKEKREVERGKEGRWEKGGGT